MITMRTILAALVTTALLAIGAPAVADVNTPGPSIESDVYGSNRQGYVVLVKGRLFAVYPPRREALADCDAEVFCLASTRALYRHLSAEAGNGVERAPVDGLTR